MRYVVILALENLQSYIWMIRLNVVELYFVDWLSIIISRNEHWFAQYGSGKKGSTSHLGIHYTLWTVANATYISLIYSCVFMDYFSSIMSNRHCIVRFSRYVRYSRCTRLLLFLFCFVCVCFFLSLFLPFSLSSSCCDFVAKINRNNQINQVFSL